MADDFEWRVDKSKWTAEDRESYMKLPWGVRRLVDFWGLFPNLGKWFARREIKKVEKSLKESERVSAMVKTFLEERRAKHGDPDKDYERTKCRDPRAQRDGCLTPRVNPFGET